MLPFVPLRCPPIWTREHASFSFVVLAIGVPSCCSAWLFTINGDGSRQAQQAWSQRSFVRRCTPRHLHHLPRTAASLVSFHLAIQSRVRNEEQKTKGRLASALQYHARSSMPLPVSFGSEFLQPFAQAVPAWHIGVESIAHPAFFFFESERSESVLVFAGCRQGQSRCLRTFRECRACSVIARNRSSSRPSVRKLGFSHKPLASVSVLVCGDHIDQI